MIGKNNLMNPHTPSSNASAEHRDGNRRAPEAGVPAAEIEHLVRVGRLVAPMARQIQNPVSSLLATSGLLDERMPKDDPNRGFMRLISQETVRVQEALSNLATLAEPMSLNPRTIDLPQLIDDVVEAHRVHAKRHGVRLTYNNDAAGLCIWTDRPALRLALEKLLMNAIEVMPYGGVLRVALDQGHDALGPVAQVLITDEGPHVPPELFTKLFQPFVVSPGRRPGMRLALCHMIVERLGGRMNAWNHGEVGLTVEVRLPLS